MHIEKPSIFDNHPVDAAYIFNNSTFFPEDQGLDFEENSVNFRGLDFQHTLIEENPNRKISLERSIFALAQQFNVSVDTVKFVHEVHSTSIIEANQSTENYIKADGWICNEAGVLCCVRSADCTPVLLYDKNKHALSMVHAGKEGVRLRMKQAYSTNTNDLIVYVGPSIADGEYCVGLNELEDWPIDNLNFTQKLSVDEVLERHDKGLLIFNEGRRKTIIEKNEPVYLAQMRSYILAQLSELGVLIKHTEVSNINSIRYEETSSFRRNKSMVRNTLAGILR
jgi:copper oxidase (laccase) domain-containing protein